MDQDPNKTRSDNRTDAANAPQTGIVQNPNPAANENIRERSTQPDTRNEGAQPKTGTEITDGEDG